MAHDSRLSVSTVQRIWRAFGLKPHRQETFKLSTDPDFVAKVRDVVELYMAPPEHGCCAWIRSRRSRRWIAARRCLAMRPGQPERRSHDYARRGTTPLFAALDIATGQALHADLSLLAQRSGALLQPDHRGQHPLRRVQEPGRPGGDDPAYLDQHNADPKPFVWTASAAACPSSFFRTVRRLSCSRLARPLNHPLDRRPQAYQNRRA